MGDTNAIAYTELLEIIKYLPQEEYNKIPKEKIEFYKKNKDNNYKYKFDVSKPLNEQTISRKTNSIIVSLFMDYFATTMQKEKIEVILKQNEEKYQEELRKKYNSDNIFKNRDTINYNNKLVQEEMSLVEYKIPWYRRLLNKIKEMFNK